MKKRIKNKNILALQHKGLLYPQKSKTETLRSNKLESFQQSASHRALLVSNKSKREVILNNNSLLILKNSFLAPLPPLSLSSLIHSYFFDFLATASLKAPVLTLKMIAASLVWRRYIILNLAEAR